ncbi:DgyrCDS1990 [Dimorphilus gyrociliatus]|nr:DgyrCDS1990 [Dimorphilus gyrociliatus]
MIGAVAFGFLSDKFGRKKSFIFALVTQGIVGSLTALSPNFYVFTFLRFFVGMLEQGVNITGFIMATELFPPKQRTIFGVAHEFFWAVGGCMVPLFAYFLRDWKSLQTCISLPAVLGICLWWFLPESVVWLVSQGKVKEAEKILEKAAKINRRPLPADCLSDSDKQPLMNGKEDENKKSTKERKTYTIIDLFRTKNLRKITFCVNGIWLVNTMVYYGVCFHFPNLYGDLYINFALGGLVEIPSVAVTLFLLYKVGRRWPLCLMQIVGGIMCIIIPFIPKKSGTVAYIPVALAVVVRFCFNGSFTVIYVYGPEIYPTVCRNTGAGLASSSGRIGGILYPFIGYMSKLNAGKLIGPDLPLFVYGVLSIICSLLALPLPETKNKPLPDTIEDVENYEDFCRRHSNIQKLNREELSSSAEGGGNQETKI